MSKAVFPGFPKRVVIEMTSSCNLSCPMCPRHHMQRADGFIARGFWERLIDEIAGESADTAVLPFWRGESTMHPEFAELLEYALEKSLRIHIFTNGHFPSVKYYAILNRCEFVSFSAHTDAGYQRARDFISIRENDRPIIQISFVEGEYTERAYLNSLIAEPDLGGFDCVRLYKEHSRGGAYGRSGNANGFQRTFCRKLLDTIAISFEGKVSRCNHQWEANSGIDLLRTTIKEAWISDRLLEIRDGYPDALCVQCDQWGGHTCGERWRVVDGSLEHEIFAPGGLNV